jgi:transcriptional accessory protein Tex/SPT6
MARRKNVKRIDPRYFLNESMDNKRKDLLDLLSDLDITPEKEEAFKSRIKDAEDEDKLEDLESEMWPSGS